MSSAFLKGTRVLDLSQFLPGSSNTGSANAAAIQNRRDMLTSSASCSFALLLTVTGSSGIPHLGQESGLSLSTPSHIGQTYLSAVDADVSELGNPCNWNIAGSLAVVLPSNCRNLFLQCSQQK